VAGNLGELTKEELIAEITLLKAQVPVSITRRRNKVHPQIAEWLAGGDPWPENNGALDERAARALEEEEAQATVDNTKERD